MHTQLKYHVKEHIKQYNYFDDFVFLKIEKNVYVCCSIYTTNIYSLKGYTHKFHLNLPIFYIAICIKHHNLWSFITIQLFLSLTDNK